MNDLKYFTKFSHTGILEIYHTLYNKWAPKGQHFAYLGMITQSQLAIMDFKKGSKLEHATTKAGEKRYICFSKITNNWSSKPMKGQKETSYLKNMVNEMIKHCLFKQITTNSKNSQFTKKHCSCSKTWQARDNKK